MAVEFEGVEHKLIAKFKNIQDTILDLPNGSKFSYGELITMGDFYGIPEVPISMGADEQEREKRFENSFNTLAVDQYSVGESKKILELLKIEENAISEVYKKDGQPHQAYENLGETLNVKWANLTRSLKYPFGRYISLSLNNFDHFGENAVKSYIAGHSVALRVAKEGYETKGYYEKEKLYKLSLAMNAFADHFLTDIFSSGHMRTPRTELYDSVSLKVLSGQLSRNMHDEDNKIGLHVQNANGKLWYAYGDGHLLDTKSTDNFNMVVSASAASCGEIIDAFEKGETPSSTNDFKALKIIPILSLINDPSFKNHSPMFKVENGKVVVRKDINDIYCTGYTGSWYGITTAAKIAMKSYNPKDLNAIPSPTVAPTVEKFSEPQSDNNDGASSPKSKIKFSFSYKNTKIDGQESDFGKWTEDFDSDISEFVLTIPTKDSFDRVLYRQIGVDIYQSILTIPFDKSVVYLHFKNDEISYNLS